MSTNMIQSLEDADAALLLKNLQHIMRLSNECMSAGGDIRSKIHEIYVISRDSSDIMRFDAVSRDVMRRLSGGGQRVMGIQVDEDIIQIARGGRKIEAIKTLRDRTGTGLKEAKDAIEALEL